MIDHESDANDQTKIPYTITILEQWNSGTVEQWESVEHLNAHLHTPPMRAYQKQVKDDVLNVKIWIMQKGLSR